MDFLIRLNSRRKSQVLNGGIFSEIRFFVFHIVSFHHAFVESFLCSAIHSALFSKGVDIART